METTMVKILVALKKLLPFGPNIIISIGNREFYTASDL